MSEIDNRRQHSESLIKEIFEFCQSESISEDGLREIIEQHDGLREIIERHGLTTQNLSSFHLGRLRFFHAACYNERVTEGIIQCLLEYFPAAASAVVSDDGQLPLHYACQNPNMTFNIIQLLIDAAPDSVRSVNHKGFMPLDYLCTNRKLDQETSIDILKLLIEKCPEAVRHDVGFLPIHISCGFKSPEFCRALVNAYPGSERITDVKGNLPLHCACLTNSLATVEYLYKLYPDAINHTTTRGAYPIHYAIMRMSHRDVATDAVDIAVDIVKFLLDCDPIVTLQRGNGKSLLHFACHREYTDSNIHAGLEMIKVIYDAHPKAIEDDRIASNIHRYHQQVQSFINTHLVYSRQAKNHRLMITPDDNGQLPLHTALQHNVRLGSIKLLVKGNPSAIRNVDANFAMPLHVACQHHSSANVIQYLVRRDTSILDAIDRKGDTALHYACHGAKYDNISLLLEKYDAVSISKRNAHGKLPIDLLWESNAVEDRESIEHTESVFRLLKAYPETVMNYNLDMKQQGTSDRCSNQNGKKRKLDAV